MSYKLYKSGGTWIDNLLTKLIVKHSRTNIRETGAPAQPRTRANGLRYDTSSSARSSALLSPGEMAEETTTSCWQRWICCHNDNKAVCRRRRRRHVIIVFIINDCWWIHLYDRIPSAAATEISRIDGDEYTDENAATTSVIVRFSSSK